jgi:hypothetical protein
MALKGIIRETRPSLRGGRLRVVVRVAGPDGRDVDAFLPERELAALLPRTLLAGDRREVPASLLQTIAPLVRRMAAGREVRVWGYGEGLYCSFASWRSVRFVTEEPGEPAPGQDAEGDGDVQGALGAGQGD